APCCTADNFSINLNDTPRCGWNRSAALVFTNWYIAHAPAKFSKATSKEIQEAFFTHVGSLRRKHLEESKEAEEKAQGMKIARARERQRNVSSLFYRRRDAMEFFPSLRHGIEMLDRLHVDGMSEDDSDAQSDVDDNWGYPPEVPVYRVLKKRWRNPRVTAWLRAVDVFYPEYLQARPKQKRKERVTQVHIRVDSSRYAYEDRDPVVGDLPIDAYSDAWVARLNEFEKQKFMIREDETFGFQHN
ncbi:hypothetical protein DENSPDRAFT_752367, partial [Dentipellis sp. KUC8613]